MAPPFRIAEFDILYGHGISVEGCILDVAADMGIVKKAGTWFSYGDTRLGQGREKARDFLKENPVMMAEIDQGVRAKLAEQKLAVATPPVVVPSPSPEKVLATTGSDKA